MNSSFCGTESLNSTGGGYGNIKMSSSANYTNSSIVSRPRTLSFGNNQSRPGIRRSNGTGFVNRFTEKTSLKSSGTAETNHCWSKA